MTTVELLEKAVALRPNLRMTFMPNGVIGSSEMTEEEQGATGKIGWVYPAKPAESAEERLRALCEMVIEQHGGEG
jgi:hypothetical protein